jgi:hypothetical protein
MSVHHFPALNTNEKPEKKIPFLTAITIHCQDQKNPPAHLKPPTKNIKEFWKFFQTSIFPTNTTSHPPTAEKTPTFNRDP